MTLPPLSAVPVFSAARSPQVPEPEAARTAREFETTFLAQSFEEVLKTLPASSFGGGEAAGHWRHFLAQSMAGELAASGRTGIGETLVPLIEGRRP